MIDFSPSEEVVLLGEQIVRFIDSEVVPLEQMNARLLSSERYMFDENGRYVPDLLALRKQVRMKSAEAGFYTMLAPAELGGGGLDALAAAYVNELIGRTYGPGRVLIHPVVLPSPFTNGLSPVLQQLSPELREVHLPFLASGERTMCFALSEPDAGSDVFAIRTTAVREGDHWVINGTKQWISNSPYADYAMVFAVTDREAANARKGGITGFFVDTATPGFTVTGIIPLMGHLGGDTGIVALEELRVLDATRLGEVGKGLKVAMNGVNNGRLGLGGQSVGYALWALAKAVDYAKTRRSFGRPIGEHQAVQMLLADCAIEIAAAKNMVLNCAWRVANGLSVRKEIPIVKAYATEMLNRVMDRCIQIHGGMGLTNELRLEEGYRYARLQRIPDGTGEIHRRNIARALLDGDAAF